MEQIEQHSISIEKKIYKLSCLYNYFGSEKVFKIISNLTEEEDKIVLGDPKVQTTISHIDDVDILRRIFRISRPFFQEIMFSNEGIQDILISPRKSLKRKELFENYNKKDYVFSNEEIRKLEVFLHTIKSPLIYEQLIESKFFQRIIALCYEKQLGASFFKGMDVKKLFSNIVNDEDVYKTRINRKRNIINIFNKVSDHILLPDDYKSVIQDPDYFIKSITWRKHNAKQIFIDKKTLSIFSTSMINELLEIKNIDQEELVTNLRDDVLQKINENNYDFSNIFNHLTRDGLNKFNGVDFLYFNIIIDFIKDNEVVKDNFLEFIYSILLNNEFNKDQKESIKNALYQKMKSKNITRKDYECLFNIPSSHKTLFYLRFNKISQRMDYLNGISVYQIMNINIRHINMILKYLEPYVKYDDELSNIYSYAIKAYLIFGLERTIKILKGDYGEINRYFFDNLSKTNVSKIKLVNEGSKYVPIISDGFINFMFAKQNDNHFIDMLKNNEGLLNKYWCYFYNEFDEFKEKCHNVLTLKKVNIILDQFSPSKSINDVSPSNYKLKEKDIINDICLGNKTGKSNEEIYKLVINIYEKMKYRTESSIPYINGMSSTGYRYEMMKLNDPIAFTLGYKCSCCFRTGDIGHNHLLHAILCRNGRILLIYDENNKLVAFIPLKRNGEVLIANSIEHANKWLEKDNKAILTFSEAINEIIRVSKENEEEPINLVCIGRKSILKPFVKPFPSNIKVPTIYEKKDDIYKDTDCYHRSLDVVYKDNNLNFNNIKYGNPKYSYEDPRNKISYCNFKTAINNDIEKALNVINAVRFTNCDIDEIENFKLTNRNYISDCIYNDDWYIVVNNDGNIYCDYLKYDERAKKELAIAYNELKNTNISIEEISSGMIRKLG